MIFSDIRVQDIGCVLHFTPQAVKFTTKNRKHHIIGIQLSGNAEHYFQDRHFNLSENCIYFFNRQEDYRVEVAEKGLAFSIQFSTYEPIDTKSFRIKIEDSSSILRSMHIIEQQFTHWGKSTAKGLSELYNLLSKFEEIYEKKYTPKDDRLQSARNFMNLHFKENDCIEKAAQQYGLTRRRFNDLFKQRFHTTPKQYIIDYKVGLAKNIMSEEALSITEIAELCGFLDVYHFSKVFKKTTGQTPSAYRKSL